MIFILYFLFPIVLRSIVSLRPSFYRFSLSLILSFSPSLVLSFLSAPHSIVLSIPRSIVSLRPSFSRFSPSLVLSFLSVPRSIVSLRPSFYRFSPSFVLSFLSVPRSIVSLHPSFYISLIPSNSFFFILLIPLFLLLSHIEDYQ